MAFERLHPGTAEWMAYYGNHIARYRFAAERLRAAGSRKVLDAACGVGYGSHYLATHLGIAVDQSEEALGIARKDFAHERVRHLQDDCHTLAAAAAHGPFDAIVSMETLEHLPNQAAFLAACRERLRPGGLLLVSTPNAHSTGHSTGSWNFHEKELSPKEFDQVLRQAAFSTAELWSQDFNDLGRLRHAMRAELHALRSQPFARLGSWVQRTLRGRKARQVLPECEEDYAFARIESVDACEALGARGPMVLLAVATR
jgi:cyclopropane fatty-acyl-phospholipid synthase-like methyltransferase